MPRLNVDAADYFRVLTAIADTNPVGVIPNDDEYVRGSAGYADGGLRIAPFPIPIPTTGLANAPMIHNQDTVPHDFLYFVRGTDVEGGTQQIFTAAQTIAAGASAPVPLNPLLMPGQRLELEMQEAVTTNPPVLSALWAQMLYRALEVAGYRFGSQIESMNDANPSTLLAGTSRRIPLAFIATLSALFNRDSLAIDILYTADGLPVRTNAAVAAGATFDPGGTVLLDPAESIVASTTTTPTTTDPLMWWTYVDLES